jgi:hypothetical protein
VLAAGQRVYLMSSSDPAQRGLIVAVDPFALPGGTEPDPTLGLAENRADGRAEQAADGVAAHVNEIRADKQATAHKLKFFENAATPNLAIKYPREVTADQLQVYLDLIDEEHQGAQNAYKTLHIGGGGDPMIVGANMRQIDFKVTQGAGETRIAAASGIPRCRGSCCCCC